MKLVSKQVEGRKIHRIYDAAKTPLQRVLRSGVLSPLQQQELCAIGKAFDPLRLFQHVEQLQQATLRCEAGRSSINKPAPALELLPFDLAECIAEYALPEESEADKLPQEEQKRASVLDWRRTSKDPFVGQWEQILAWVQANPTRSSGDMLRELQSQFPGHYEHAHLRTLQRGVRKIRAQVLQTPEETGSPEACQEYRLSPPAFQHARSASESSSSSFLPVSVGAPSSDEMGTHLFNRHQAAEDLPSRTSNQTRRSVSAGSTSSKSKPGQIVRRAASVSARSAPQTSSREKGQRLTMERAIQQYLQAHRQVGHRPKTLEWHQMALSHLHQYLRTECCLLLVHQITETATRNWLASLEQTPITRGARRSASTIATYVRSARAFCGWLVERGVLSCSPLSESAVPRTSVPLPHVVSPAIFEQIMRAGFSQHVQVREAKRLIARDRALLWVLFDTGITVAELCALRVADLDQQMSLLRVWGKGGKERQLPRGATCQSHLLRQMDPTTRRGLARRHAGGDPLFASQGKQPLTTNGVSMVFARFRKRAGISESAISPQVLRHSFALRYLQAGGNPRGLAESATPLGFKPEREPEERRSRQKTPSVRSVHLWERGPSSLFSRAPKSRDRGNGLDLTWCDRFTSPCLTTIILLSCTGPPVFRR